MNKWSGIIGFYVNEEVLKDGRKTGVWKSHIIEKKYFGDILRDFRSANPSDSSTNDNVSINNTISILSDQFINNHIMDIKYVTFKGFKFKVSGFSVNYPRIEMSLGGLYNGEST